MNTRSLTVILLLAALAVVGIWWFGGDSPKRSLSHPTVEPEGLEPELTDARSDAPLQPPNTEPQVSPQPPTQSPSPASVRSVLAGETPAGGVRVEFVNAATGAQIEPQQVLVSVVQTSDETLASLFARYPNRVVPHDDRDLQNPRHGQFPELVTPGRDGWLALPSGLVSISLKLDVPSSQRFLPAGTETRFVLSESKKPITFLLAEPLVLRLRVNDQFGAPATGIVLRAMLIGALPFLTEPDQAPQRMYLQELERGLYVGPCLPGQLNIEARSPGWSGSLEFSIPNVTSECLLTGELTRIQYTASLLLIVDGVLEGTEVRLKPLSSSVGRKLGLSEWRSVEPNGVLFRDLGPGKHIVQARSSTGARRGLVHRLGTVVLPPDEQTTARFAFVPDERMMLLGKFAAATAPLEHFTVGLIATDAGPLGQTWNTSNLDGDRQFQIEVYEAGTFDLRIRVGDYGRWHLVEELTFATQQVIERTFLFPASAIPDPTPAARALDRKGREKRISLIESHLGHTIGETDRLLLVKELTALRALEWLK